MSIKKKYLIKSVLGGIGPSTYFGQEGQFSASVGIDPEVAVSTGLTKPSGAIIPTRYETFTGDYATVFTGAPMWTITNPKNELVYSYLNNGKFFSYSNTLGSETLIGTPTSGAGNGAAYYNNYIYLATPTQIFRYGPLNNSPTLSNALIANGELLDGWDSGSDTLLTNTPYPAVSSVTFPNHAMHEHVGKLYICDFVNGVGKIHFIQTNKLTNEGDSNNGSTYNNTFILPFGFYPFDIESYGTDLAIICSQITASAPVTKQGKAVIFLWDTFSTKPYRKIDLPDALGTALFTHNGVPHVWSGAVGNGVTLSRYIGGNQVEPLLNFPNGTPPFAGAVDAAGNRLIWGGATAYVNASAGVYARGYVNPQLPAGALNQIAVIPNTGTIITSVKYVTEGNSRPIIGWRNNQGVNTFGMSKVSTSASFAGDNIWYSEIISVGQPFQVTKIRFPLGASVTSNMTVVPTVYIDDNSSSTALDNIDTTLYSGKRNAIFHTNVSGQHNFFIGLSFSNTTVLPVLLPIEITVELLKD